MAFSACASSDDTIHIAIRALESYMNKDSYRGRCAYSDQNSGWSLLLGQPVRAYKYHFV
jgi:hypothetical protein